MSWKDFIVFCQKLIDDYNNHQHTALPKKRDDATGKMRHMTPNEAWQKAIDGGWEPMMLLPGEAAL